MSDLDRQLEQEYKQQRQRLNQLDASVNELREVSDQGTRAGGMILKLVLAVVALVAALVSVVMLADAHSRPWFFLMVFCLGLGGAWSYWRKLSG